MSITKQLNKALSLPEPVQRGKVTSVRESSILVSSRAGLKEFQVSTPASYKTGDTVKFQGNTFLGRIPSSATSTIKVV